MTGINDAALIPLYYHTPTVGVRTDPAQLEATRKLLEVQRVRCWLEGNGSMLCQRVWFDDM